ncbi:MAG: hypothetical protein FWF60_01850 [Oscillospiraceae bacterium]|nr:hypothetical protein [Oscillospiraceae bacterium]
MNDCCGFCPGWYYYMDCRGNFWVPYEVPADSCGGCDECWCWQGCPPPTGSTGATGSAGETNFQSM